MSSKRLYNAYRFFKARAGYVVGQRAIGALALARAEAWAEDNDATFLWNWDPDTDLGDHAYWCNEYRRITAGYDRHGNPVTYHRDMSSYCNHETEYCQMLLPGDNLPVASLGGIIDADRTYRRVIEAE